MPETSSREYLTLEPLATRIDIHQRYSEVPDDVEAAVLAAIGPIDGKDLLDVGCGTGAFLRNLAGRGHAGKLVGVDTSPAAVANLSSVDRVRVQLADAANLPFGAGVFDLVTARHMLYHVGDVDRALQEARRVLAPGGIFVAVVNHEDTMPYLGQLVADGVSTRVAELPALPRMWIHTGNLPGMMRDVFGEVEIHRYDNALVFDRPEPLVAYAVSLLGFYGIGPDSPLRSGIAETIESEARAWFREPGRIWRDPKGYVVCVGRIDP